MTDRIETTQSMWQSFKNCRKKMELRYLRGLRTLTDAPPLTFGRIIHDAIERHHRQQDVHEPIALAVATGQLEPADGHMAHAMMDGYARRWANVHWNVVALEMEFRVPIRNPATGALSKSFVLRGRVDGLIERNGELWLVEHKTKSGPVDGTYLERLWTDFQIAVYAGAVEDYTGRPVAGVIYNVLCKARLKQREGETQEAYEERYALACSMSKTGKSSARRKVPESDSDFRARLDDWYDNPDAFARQELVLSPARVAEVKDEIWELTQAYLEARRRGVWYQNTSQCFSFNRPCEYYALCRSGGNEIIEQTHFRLAEPNEELSPTDQPQPAF